MVYSNRFVMCVIVDGQIQKEAANGQIAIPFGSQYTLRFRNKHNRRAMVKIYIDGENVSGNGYIINANDHVDIRRHHDVDRAFKFVALDSPDAVDHGKNGPNTDKVKGTIEARFWLEKERKVTYRPQVVEHHHHHWYEKKRKIKDDPPKPWNPYPQPWVIPTNPGYPPNYPQVWCSNDTSGGTPRGMTGGGTQSGMHPSSMSYNNQDMGEVKATWNESSQSDWPELKNPYQSPIPDKIKIDKLEDLKLQVLAQNPCILGVPAPQPPVLQEGCTVEGGSTGQSFYTVAFDAEEDYVSVKIFLVGFVSDKPVVTAAPEPAAEEVKHCTNCGAKKAKKKAKFCHNCGAKL